MLTWVLFATGAAAGELGELLHESLQHPAVRAAQAGVVAAAEQARAQDHRYFGAGAAFAEGSRYEDRRFVGAFAPAVLASPDFARDQFRFGFSYQLPIDLAGAIAATRRAARHELAAARLGERQATLLKLHDALSAYVQLQTLLRQREVLGAQRQRVEQTVERVARQVQIEQASVAEQSLAQAELARLLSDEVRLAGAFDQAQAALEEASGRRLVPASAAIGIPELAPQDVAAADFLPAVLSAQRAAGAAAQALAVRRALWPGVAAVADFSRFETDVADPELWSVGARLSLPIDPEGWRRVGAAEALADAQAHAQIAAERTARRDQTALLAAYRTARADAEALETEVEARAEVVRVQAELQRVGLASLEEFLRQQRDLLDAESRRAGARAQAAVSWSAIQVLLGTEVQRYIDEAESAAAGVGSGP